MEAKTNFLNLWWGVSKTPKGQIPAPGELPFLLTMSRWSKLWPLQRKMWNPENAGETRQAVSFPLPLENSLLERDNRLFASVFFPPMSLKEGDLGSVSKRRFQDRNVDRRIGGAQQSSGLIVFGIV